MPVSLRDCPVCSKPFTVRELHCSTCDITVRGEFEPGAPGPFSQLNDEQLAFLHLFVTSRGNMSDVERSLGVSYPTVRAKLDDLIGALTIVPEPPAPRAPVPPAPPPPAVSPPPAPEPVTASNTSPSLSRSEILAGISDGSISVDEGMDLMRRLSEE